MRYEVWLLLALFTKHFIIDFPLQTKYQWSNKGKYGHPGGLLHAGLHGLGSIIVFVFFVFYIEVAIILGLIDAIIHYHIDWAKMNLNTRMEWGANTSEKFWWLLGFDQYLHAVTYIGLALLIGI